MDETLEDLVAWATKKGVKLNGIEPMRLEESGIGVIAKRDIQVRLSRFTLTYLPTKAPTNIIDINKSKYLLAN